MGGYGSGNWFRWNARKSTVEESLVLAMHEFPWLASTARGRHAYLDLDQRQQVFGQLVLYVGRHADAYASIPLER